MIDISKLKDADLYQIYSKDEEIDGITYILGDHLRYIKQKAKQEVFDDIESQNKKYKGFDINSGLWDEIKRKHLSPIIINQTDAD